MISEINRREETVLKKTWYKSKESLAVFGCILATIVMPTFSLLVNIPAFLKSKTKVGKSVFLVLILVVVSYLALHVIPAESNDLYRHYEKINIYIQRDFSFSEAFSRGYSGVYLHTAFSYLVAQTGITELYAAILVPCTFAVFLWFFKNMDTKIELSIKQKLATLIFLFFAMTPRSAFLGVRNHLVYFLLAYFIWLFLEEGKTKVHHIVMMCLACTALYFFHMAAIVIVAIFVLFLIYEKSCKSIKIAIALLLLFSIAILYLMNYFCFTYLEQLSSIPLMQKVLTYAGDIFVFDNFNHYLMLVGLIIALAILICFVRYNEKHSKFTRFNQFYFVCILFSIGSIPNFDIMSRNTYFLSIAAIPVFYQFFHRYQHKRVIMLGFYAVWGCFIVAQVIFTWRSLVAYPWEFDITVVDLWFNILT